MIVSHKYKFVTIDIPKTATTSINAAMGQFIHENDISVSISQKIGMRHATYEKCIAKFPSSKNYFSFVFVRNPWDRMLSFWFFKKGKIDVNMSFKEFLSRYNHSDQYSYIEGFGNNSFIGRFENLQQDFNIVCDKIGIPQQQLPHANKTKHKHYTEYYDDETREIVAERYARDIEYFGYKLICQELLELKDLKGKI